MKNLSLWLDENRDYLIGVRRHLHANPEIGYEEKNTSEYLKNLFASWGYEINSSDEMGYGFTVEIPKDNGPLLALRCDLDALPIQDLKSTPYSSQMQDIMHACGHDVHMTILTGLAKFLKESNSCSPGSLRLLFQPAEECSPGGSIGMIKGGAIKDVNHIVGYHVYPKLNAGSIAFKAGHMSANVDVIDVELKCSGGHTSRPEESADLILVTSALIQKINQNIQKIGTDSDPVVLVFGSIKGGHTFNVIPAKVILKGTIRYCDPDSKQSIYDCIQACVDQIRTESNVDIKWQVPYSSPGVSNDLHLFNIASKAAGEILGDDKITILEKSSLGGEDFSYYLEKIPGFYFRLGCYNGKASDLHCAHFDVDENCIFTGISVLNEFITHYFQQEKDAEN